MLGTESRPFARAGGPSAEPSLQPPGSHCAQRLGDVKLALTMPVTDFTHATRDLDGIKKMLQVFVHVT